MSTIFQLAALAALATFAIAFTIVVCLGRHRPNRPTLPTSRPAPLKTASVAKLRTAPRAAAISVAIDGVAVVVDESTATRSAGAGSPSLKKIKKCSHHHHRSGQADGRRRGERGDYFGYCAAIDGATIRRPRARRR